MDESFDVVVVGARCAGTVLAHHLARAGARVAVLDRAALPGGEVISTHVFQNSAVRSLERLGVLDRVRAPRGRRRSPRASSPWTTVST